MPQYRELDWEPIKAPMRGAPPISVWFKIPQEASAPNALQLQLLENITNAFPTLWNSMLDELRRAYGYIQVVDGSFPLHHPESAITFAGVGIPDMEEYRDDPSYAVPWTLDTHAWFIYPVLVESILDLMYTEASFEGMNLVDVHLHW